VNFFEHQDRARKQSRRLILAFIAAVVAIVVAVDGILLAVATMSIGEPHVPGLPIRERIAANQPLLIAGAAVTLGVIFLASLFKTLILRSGGGQVARQLGGTLVESGSRDAKRRRLRNVVEEIALASGVPVPEIYVLERESGINAFAAGYTPSDAAIAVTRGALDKLDRDELQGVIAHEFSHILNGDMRINIRLMGMLFGILLLALIGRRVLMHARFGRSDRNGAAVMLVALGLMAVGYVGLFFGRWIKAGVSRQREYLADASAVQFTRDPTGIGGALKKIAIYAEGSQLAADTEEIGHMLFGSGQRATIFSTHPPLHERIRRIDPAFRPEELQELAAGLRREQQAELNTRAGHFSTPADCPNRSAACAGNSCCGRQWRGPRWPTPCAGRLDRRAGRPRSCSTRCSTPTRPFAKINCWSSRAASALSRRRRSAPCSGKPGRPRLNSDCRCWSWPFPH
jgi:Zn-dependent protease with chaperone function